jgi:hypothetical protein
MRRARKLGSIGTGSGSGLFLFKRMEGGKALPDISSSCTLFTKTIPEFRGDLAGILVLLVCLD